MRFLVCLVVVFSSVAGWCVEDTPAVHVPLEGGYVRLLSEYHFFRGAGIEHIPNEGVLPYDLNTPLFSDYTAKHRFVWMPPGTSAEYDPLDVFSFPIGAVLIKSFGYLYDFRDTSLGENILETRLLIHKPEGWVGLPYVWNADKSDAVLKVAGGAIDVEWIHHDGSKRKNNYILPNLNECKSCHENGDKLLPIGPKTRNINKDYVYADGTENQLVRWAAMGYLTDVPGVEDAPRLAVWDDPNDGTLDERARAWLEVNCMHCHNPLGAASTSGLDLRYHQENLGAVGFMKRPVAAGLGAGERLFDIVPGKPDESILQYRIESINPGVMMPELPRRLLDEEGVALIREWILSLDDGE